MQNRYLVLCGSMSSYQEMLKIHRFLSEKRIQCLLPEKDEEIYEKILEKNDTAQLSKYKTNVSNEHIKKIRNPRTGAILVINPTKHNIENYIGPNTFAEIAISFISRKKVFLLYNYPHIYEDELYSWGIVPLYGDLNPILEYIQRPISYQLFLPGIYEYD